MRLALVRIAVGDRLRPVNAARAAALAESMAQKGLDQPIVVRPLSTPIGSADHMLVVGAHRLTGARLLGWPDIEVAVRDYDELAARLAEIDENLVRGELTPLDRAICLAERKRVWEELHPEARHGGDRRSTKRGSSGEASPLDQAIGFSRAAAETIGLSPASIRQAVALANALHGDTLDHLRRSAVSLNGAQLRALAKLPDAERRMAAAQLADGRAKNFGAALAAVGRKPAVDAQEQLYRALVSMWARANAKTRKRFLASVAEPTE
jgi:ParB family chromosome partitioning protein